MIKILTFLFKIKQRHTGKHIRPYIQEPVQESPGHQTERTIFISENLFSFAKILKVFRKMKKDFGNENSFSENEKDFRKTKKIFGNKNSFSEKSFSEFSFSEFGNNFLQV
jgi:hypothetical protein